MAETTTDLITRAYYLSNVVGRGLSTVSGSQLTDGLMLLNGLLSSKAASKDYIPYYKAYDFTLAPNVEKYFIPNLVAMETFTYVNGSGQTIRYATSKTGRRSYFGSARANNVSSLPMMNRVERTLNGSDLYLYFTPDAAYNAQIWGKFAFADVTLGQDLQLTLDKFYLEYLRYGLCGEIANYNRISLLPSVEKRKKELEDAVKNISPPDLSLNTISQFRSGGTLNWATANLSHGWEP